MALYDSLSLLWAAVCRGEMPLCPFVKVRAESFPELLKSQRGTPRGSTPWTRGQVRKVVEGGYQLPLESTFARKIERAVYRLHEGVVTYEAGPLWRGAGERVPELPWLARHKPSGRLYLCLHPTKLGPPTPTRTEWYAGEERLTPEEVADLAAGYLRDRNPKSPKQEGYGLTDYGTQVHPRVYHQEGIISLQCGGFVYEREGVAIA